MLQTDQRGCYTTQHDLASEAPSRLKMLPVIIILRLPIFGSARPPPPSMFARNVVINLISINSLSTRIAPVEATRTADMITSTHLLSRNAAARTVLGKYRDLSELRFLNSCLVRVLNELECPDTIGLLFGLTLLALPVPNLRWRSGSTDSLDESPGKATTSAPPVDPRARLFDRIP